MFRNMLVIVIAMIAVVGCASDSPIMPDPGAPLAQQNQYSTSGNDSPYRLWGEWTLYIDAGHERVDVVPRREARVHLNILKFLESYCTDCLTITDIKNNGDSTIDLTVQITHPFPGFPEYTGFDVKGIIMFNGSHLIDAGSSSGVELPDPCRISWRELGDPQVLNPDGYVRRWSPTYDSGNSLPIFNYWEGKYATGVPSADVNAYLDFFTTVERHMFSVNSSVSRTYKIWLPPGQPVVAGYAVEACWEPPTVTPVDDPLTDFPLTANQPEPYHLKWVVNNGEPIKEYSQCCLGAGDCSEYRVEVKQWGGITVDYTLQYYSAEQPYGEQSWLVLCEPPENEVMSPINHFSIPSPPDKYQCLYVALEHHQWPLCDTKWAYDILEFEVVE
ncbi:MAG: hypothetical protein NTY09_13365 [bacterium]|nr:hypothetical protein [bacterium]